MRIGDLERALLERFPAADAEPWDKVGLWVGRPSDEVVGVTCALDVTPATIERAYAQGSNVLVAHHPLAIDAPSRLTPVAGESSQAGACAYRAAELQVSVISMHTNLDRSLEARERLADLLGLRATSSLEHPDDPAAHGLGLLADIAQPETLRDMAARCVGAFGTEPRVWGTPDSLVHRVAVLGGSLGSFGVAAHEAGADVVIAGEAGYHVCQDVLARGTSLILLGHDRSEEPFCEVLARACADAGVPGDAVSIAAAGRQWWTYEGEERQ